MDDALAQLHPPGDGVGGYRHVVIPKGARSVDIIALLRCHEIEKNVREALRQSFKPEFLNRIDEIVVFNALGREEIREIVELRIDEARARLAQRNIELEIEDSTRSLLAEEGFDPAFGARPLKRTIQRMLLDPLAMKILAGELKDGDSIVARADDFGQILFSRKEEALQTV